MGSAAQPRSGTAPKEAAATAAPVFFRNLRRLVLVMTDSMSFFISLPHAAGADRQIGCSCFVAPHKITPCAKCKAYQGQGAMRRQAWSVRRNIEVSVCDCRPVAMRAQTREAADLDRGGG